VSAAILPGSYGCVTSPATEAPSPPFVIPDRVLSKSTGELVERLWNANDKDAAKTGDKILWCATNAQGARCGSAACPSCAARAAKRLRRDLEGTIALLPSSLALVHLTIGTGVETLLDGRQAILDGFRSLREEPAWRAHVIGGKGQIEFLPASGSSRRWNVHAHAVVWTKEGRVPVGAMRAAWARTMNAKGLPASFDWSFVTGRRFVAGHSGGGFLSGRVLRLEAVPLRAGRVPRLGACRGRARASRASVGRVVRDEGGVLGHAMKETHHG
jgi:hypothetical protein